MRRLHSSAVPGKQVKIVGSATLPAVDFLGKKMFVLTTAITSGVTTDSVGAVAGDFAVTTNATGRSNWFTSDGTNWVAMGDAGAGFTQGVAVTDPAAMTSAAATGGDAPTEAEYNALRTDVVNVRAALIALITSLENGDIIA